ncbi:MAG: hypothetical protein ACI3W5_09435 [Faecousia sp.]
MKLPDMKYRDGIRKGQQIKFSGLNQRMGASEGELWDMRNLTADHYPLLATRKLRGMKGILKEPCGLFAWEKLCWVDGERFYYDGVEKGVVSSGEKVFSSMGSYIVIFPDKCYYNVETDTFGSMEAHWSGKSLTFASTQLYDEEAVSNTMQCVGVDWSKIFRTGDAVTISGCTEHPENNKTPIIRQIDGDKLIFYENTFTLEDGAGYTEHGALSVSRTVPDLKYLCENENRLWGCTERTIYASKLGDIFNWQVYDGLDTDAWALEPGSAGNFTGCVAYRGYATFFKEDHIYKVYGNVPSEFQAMGTASMGLAPGCSKSLAIAGETLFYMSRSGVVAYTGGIPQCIGLELGSERFDAAVAGSDGLRYYASLRRGGVWEMYVFDTRFDLWHKEDSTHALAFAKQDGQLYYLESTGHIWEVDALDPNEGCLEWFAEFGDFYDGDPNKKGVSKLQIRVELGDGASMTAELQFDSDGVWRPAGSITGDGAKRSYYLPIVPRRCDHYRLRLSGAGECRIYSIVRERYSGSELKSTMGRN